MKLVPFLFLLLPVVDDPLKVPQGNAFADAKLTKEYRDGYKQGASEAEQEIKKGVVTLYSFGLRTSFDNLDRETGLPIEAIAGCIISDAIIGRRDGHDEAVMAHIKLHGLPPNSFKPWEKEVFGLERFFERESKTVKPLTLKVGERALKSPDGKYSIQPVAIESKTDDGRTLRSFGFVLGGDTMRPKTEPILMDQGQTELFWGPKDSRFAVFRSRSTQGARVTFQYMALDLQRGAWLRWELPQSP